MRETPCERLKHIHGERDEQTDTVRVTDTVTVVQTW